MSVASSKNQQRIIDAYKHARYSRILLEIDMPKIKEQSSRRNALCKAIKERLRREGRLA